MVKLVPSSPFIAVRQCSADEVLGAEALLKEYATELVVDGAPAFSAKTEIYHTLEASGLFHTIGAFLGDKLVGFVTVLVSVAPHVGVLMAVTESLFVAKAHRKTGAGLKLIRQAEACAIEKGAPCLLISAPFGGVLAEVLPRIGYVETNRIFFRDLAHA